MAKKDAPNKSQAIRDYLTANPGAMPKEVVAALKEQGIDVKANVVSVTKSNMGSKKKKKKKGGGRSAGGPNKSQAIRDYLAANPDATAKEIQPALAKDGIKVDAQMINSIKWKLKSQGGPKKAAKKKAGRPAGRPKAAAAPKASAGALTAQDLIHAKKFVDQIGGLKDAQAAIETLEKLL